MGRVLVAPAATSTGELPLGSRITTPSPTGPSHAFGHSSLLCPPRSRSWASGTWPGRWPSCRPATAPRGGHVDGHGRGARRRPLAGPGDRRVTTRRRAEPPGRRRVRTASPSRSCSRPTRRLTPDHRPAVRDSSGQLTRRDDGCAEPAVPPGLLAHQLRTPRLEPLDRAVRRPARCRASRRSDTSDAAAHGERAGLGVRRVSAEEVTLVGQVETAAEEAAVDTGARRDGADGDLLVSGAASASGVEDASAAPGGVGQPATTMTAALNVASVADAIVVLGWCRAGAGAGAGVSGLTVRAAVAAAARRVRGVFRAFRGARCGWRWRRGRGGRTWGSGVLSTPALGGVWRIVAPRAVGSRAGRCARRRW